MADNKLVLVSSLITLINLLFFSSAISNSAPNFTGNGTSSTDIRLEVYHLSHHRHRNNNNSSLADLLSLDENRFNSFQNRVVATKSTTVNPSSATSRVPLTSGLSIGTGNYYANLGLGTPAKYYAMVMDTGSSLTWLQCEPCTMSCHPQVGPVFDPSASKTYRKLLCKTPECESARRATLNDPVCEMDTNVCLYTASYGDSSYSIGYLSQDVLSLKSGAVVGRFTYGCGQENVGLFGKSDGIVGLSRDSLSLLSQASVNGFSYCLPTATLSSTPSTPAGGYLSLGNSAFKSTPYKFTPMLTDPNNPSLYFLKLTSITVAGKPLAVNPSSYRVPTILDSGTVITRVPSAIYTALQAAVVKAMSGKYPQAPAYSILETCFKGKLSDVAAAAPAVGLVFQGGSILDVKAGNLLVDVAEEGISCLGFARSRSISIIGNRQQQTVNVAYDVGNSRIGFAPGGCR
ncbi:Aspartyl protease family protein At5g10770 [Linum perenne]